MIFFQLMWQFFKTGLFAVGGGMATIPFLYDISDTFGWFTHEDILDILAVSESTPGPIGVNMATYCGFKVAGVWGAVVATLSLVLPSVIIILLVARLLKKVRDNRFVNGAFYTLRPASTALIAAAGFNIVLAVFFDVEKLYFASFARLGEVFTHVNWVEICLFAVLLALMRLKPMKKVHPIAFVALAAVVGIVFKL